MMSAKRSEGLTGRHVLIGVLAFFGTVFLANGIFLYSALSTYTGVVSDEPYRKGLHYNKRIAAAERQESLGWSADARLAPDEGLSLVLRDRNGRPVSGLFVSGVLGRPSTNQHDRNVTLTEVEPGRYVAPIGLTRCLAGRSAGGLDRHWRQRACLQIEEAGMGQVLTDIAAAPITEGGRKQQEVPLETTMLVVENMHCGGCMRKVEQALSSEPGVVSARANLSARRVTVVSEKGRRSAEDLIEALAKAGYKAAPLPRRYGRCRAGRPAVPASVRGGLRRRQHHALSVSVWSGQAGDMEQSLQTLFHWLSALIALPAVAYAGQPFFRSAVEALKSRNLNMDVPISLAILLATGMSLYQTMRGSEHVYFDASVSLLFFLLIGRFLDQRMRTRAAGAAANLLGLRSMMATVIEADGSTERLPARLLSPGMRILVATGERIGVDGRVVEGAGAIDESLITGEATPVTVEPGRQVFAGTLNMGQPLVVEATATNEGTLLAEIGRLMTAAEQGRGRYVRLADRAARLYAPAVHLLGLLTFIGWMLLGHGWEAALTAAIAVLIITCPCALALAVPAVQVAASSRLFGQGVLVKAADGLERLSEVDTIIFDKTGTLTMGEPRLVDPQSCSDELLNRAAALAAVYPYAVVVKEARAV